MSKTGKEHVKTLHDTNTTLRIEEMVEEFDKRWPIIETEIGDDHPYLNLRDLRSYYVKSLTQAHQAGIDEVVESARDRIEQAHMAGYHSCCGRDSSYSEARNYHDTIKALQDKEEDV